MLLPILGVCVCCPHTQGVALGWLLVAPLGRTNQMLSFYRITDAHTQWCRIANPTQLLFIFNGVGLQIRHNYKSNTTANPTQLKECLGRSELGWICNPAPTNIRICNPKYTVLTFFRITDAYIRWCRIVNPPQPLQQMSWVASLEMLFRMCI